MLPGPRPQPFPRGCPRPPAGEGPARPSGDVTRWQGDGPLPLRSRGRQKQVIFPPTPGDGSLRGRELHDAETPGPFASAHPPCPWEPGRDTTGRETPPAKGIAVVPAPAHRRLSPALGTLSTCLQPGVPLPPSSACAGASGFRRSLCATKVTSLGPSSEADGEMCTPAFRGSCEDGLSPGANAPMLRALGRLIVGGARGRLSRPWLP